MAASRPDAAASVSRTGVTRVLMVTPRYYPLSGGVEHHVRQVAERLARLGIEVSVLTTDPSGRLRRRELLDGVTVRRVRAWPSNRDYYFAPSIYTSIRRGDWDIVHCQSYHTLVAPLAMAAAVRAGLPYVVTFHGGGSSSRLRHAARGQQLRLLRPLLARADKLVAVAGFEVDLYGKLLGVPRDRFAVIPNGADVTAVPHPDAPPPSGSLIISIGRLERYKGHQRILAAFPAVLARRPDARLWIMGEGRYEGALRKQAQDLRVADRVEIRAIPPGNRQAMADALSGAALVTLLSEYETHPIAVLEALALGRSVLVADTSGLHELAMKGLVRAIPLVSTPRQVAAAVLAQLEQPLQPKDVVLPTWDSCTHELLALYDRVWLDRAARTGSCGSAASTRHGGRDVALRA